MKINAKVKQPTPDEIISDYLKDHDSCSLIVDGNFDHLTDDGKAAMAIGLKIFMQFSKGK